MTNRPEPNPTVARRELAIYFRELRDQRGRSLSDLGRLLGVSQGQASKLDSGARGFSPDDVERLAAWYGLGPGERRRLLAVADEARRRAWWQQYDLGDSYRTLIGLERAAESIYEFCNFAIPGLVQTERYAQASVEIAGYSADEVAKAVKVRLQRQDLFAQERPPELSVIIDEVVLARGAGGSEIMREQFEKLLAVIDRPRTSIRVISFQAGMYWGAASQFILLGMGSRLPDVYYSEDQVGAQESIDREIVRRNKAGWRRLEKIALDPVRSARLISRYRDQISS